MDTPKSDQEVAEAIRRYLAEHPQAMDTAEGIAQWWIARQTVRVSVSTIVRVLDGLVQRDLIEELGHGEQRRYRLKRHKPPN